MSEKSGKVLSELKYPTAVAKKTFFGGTHTKRQTHVLDCMTVTAKLAAQTSLTFKNAKGTTYRKLEKRIIQQINKSQTIE